MGGSRDISLTRDFTETIKARIDRDPAFREELLEEGIECLLSGDLETGKAVLRDLHQRHDRVSRTGQSD